MNPSLAIIVVNYGSHALLAKNFTGNQWQESDGRLFVVDNFTTESELAALNEIADRNGWTVIPSPTNVGFGAGVNLGVAAAIAAGHHCLLLANPDLAIDQATVSALRDQVIREPMTMVSPQIVTPTGKLWFDGGYVDMGTGRVKTAIGANMKAPFAWLSGACLGLSAELWAKSNGFDPEYFLYWEDLDFSQRVVHAGGTLLVRDDLRVIHDVGGTQGHGKSAVYLHYNTRNRLLFAAKWLPAAVVRRWVRHTPVESYRVMVRGGRRSLFQWPMIRSAIAGSTQGWWACRTTDSRSQQTTALTGTDR